MTHKTHQKSKQRRPKTMNEITPIFKKAIPCGNGITPDLMDRFLRFLDASPKTIATYTRALRQMIRYLISREKRYPTREDLIEWREGLKADHKPATIQAYIAVARLFFRWTAQEGIYPNIADHIKSVRLDYGHKKDALTAEQVQIILKKMRRETVTNKRDFAIFCLMVNCALRDIEISRANIEDLRPVGGAPALYIQGKGHTERGEYVKMDAITESIIRDYLAARQPESESEPLFVSFSNNSAGGRLSTRSISGIIKNIFRNAGYDSPRLTAHSLRHTGITIAAQTLEIKEVSKYARHKKIETTMIYYHELDRAANRCGAVVGNAIYGGYEKCIK